MWKFFKDFVSRHWVLYAGAFLVSLLVSIVTSRFIHLGMLVLVGLVKDSAATLPRVRAMLPATATAWSKALWWACVPGSTVAVALANLIALVLHRETISFQAFGLECLVSLALAGMLFFLLVSCRSPAILGLSLAFGTTAVTLQQYTRAFWSLHPVLARTLLATGLIFTLVGWLRKERYFGARYTPAQAAKKPADTATNWKWSFWARQELMLACVCLFMLTAALLPTLFLTGFQKPVTNVGTFVMIPSMMSAMVVGATLAPLRAMRGLPLSRWAITRLFMLRALSVSTAASVGFVLFECLVDQPTLAVCDLWLTLVTVLLCCLAVVTKQPTLVAMMAFVMLSSLIMAGANFFSPWRHPVVILACLGIWVLCMRSIHRSLLTSRKLYGINLFVHKHQKVGY